MKSAHPVRDGPVRGTRRAPRRDGPAREIARTAARRPRAGDSAHRGEDRGWGPARTEGGGQRTRMPRRGSETPSHEPSMGSRAYRAGVPREASTESRGGCDPEPRSLDRIASLSSWDREKPRRNREEVAIPSHEVSTGSRMSGDLLSRSLDRIASSLRFLPTKHGWDREERGIPSHGVSDRIAGSLRSPGEPSLAQPATSSMALRRRGDALRRDGPSPPT